MKICFLSYNLTNGGAQRVASVLCNDLVNRHEVLVIVKERTEKEYAVDPRVKVVSMDEESEKFRNARHKDLAAISVLRKIYKREKPDYVMAFLGCSEASHIAALGIKGLHYIATIQNSPWSKPESRFRRLTRDISAVTSEACMVQNHEQATYFPQWAQKKLFIVRNPVDPMYINCQEHEYRPLRKMVSLGRLHDQKNQEMMIEAFALAADDMDPQVQLEIYGDGPKKEKLHRMLEEKGLTDRIHIYPFHSKPLELYQSADAFILSSNYEGMPNALLEAMTVGLPCITTDCKTGPKDIIRDGENGFLVPMNQPEIMAEKIRYLASHPEDGERMGRAAREDVLASYVLETVSRNLEQDLMRIGSRHGR